MTNAELENMWEEFKSFRKGHVLVELMDERLAKGRLKYPRGCTLLSLVDEVGEVVHAMNKNEGIDRVRDELLDVIAVATRLYLGEVDGDEHLVGLGKRVVQR